VVALSDRVELLATALAVNVADGGLLSGLRSETHYVDLGSGFEFGNVLAASRDVMFGDDRVGDVMTGRGGDDHLYGGDGADTIIGNGGNDYIEGNAGDDVLLDGGAGNDILLGQQGNDILVGGADHDRLNGGLGDDRLEGGTGSDQYTYFTGQGRDTITDADHNGSIVFDGQVLVGGVHRSGDPADLYTSADGRESGTQR
jgi:Ca2+-binding RTX toxin-like protein